MNEPFVLKITYQNKPLELPAAFQRYGYTYRIAVSILDQSYVFEPDEEGRYRVLGAPAGVTPDPGLLQAIAEKLAKLG
ncbi:hypothetical protein D0C36_16215 [Mucilaginibacter conchicola]|uniref:Uncharacterized protein n=1 Tax=Mucilaginibacter conchicola TaxID=2303333 RepID=A0A372NV06_9SPHI|nr:hypothetical protein [Mucilaginibacter conchicola]RFZ92932.1 hypothetical protein D0C36_16215 [Mucilaginibacter conchicola]